jgi:hypothetical protein
MALLSYLLMAMVTGRPFFQEGEERLASLRDIYMTPMFDQEPVFPLAFTAAASSLMSLLYFSQWFSDFSSRPWVGRSCAALSLALLVLATANFSRYVVFPCLWATLFSLWAWRRSDPGDDWW